MTASKIFLYFCLSFIGGIFLSSFLNFSQLILQGLLILALILISVSPSLSYGKRARLLIAGFCVLFLIFGVWRYQIAEFQTMNSELKRLNDLDKEIVLTGIVVKEPDKRETILRLIVESEKLKEKILITANRYPEYQYGDELRITGILKTPPIFEDFNYQQYLKKDGIHSVMSWPKIELVAKDFGNPVVKFLLSFKNKFEGTAEKFISPPQIGLLEALFSGSERNISKEWKEKLNFTGTRHIAAVSGMNITIIASLILSFLLSLGFWRQQAFYLSVILLLLYILMIGAPASAVRAGIMGILLMTAQYFGRMSVASRAVVIAAFFMVLINPFLLRLDIGFQLSFLAILGIIYLQPFLAILLKKIPNFRFFSLKTTLSTTLAAQIFTLPILVYNFGYIPLVSPFANILIVPFLAPVTILIFIFGMLTMIFEPLGYLLSLPLWLSLTYVIKIIDWFSKLSFASLSLQNLHWVWLIISYLLLGFLVRRLQEKQKLKFLNY